MEDDRNEGNVKFYNPSKGYGFISPTDGSKDVFVHVTGLSDEQNPLAADELVSFKVEDGKKGPQAVDVRRVN